MESNRTGRLPWAIVLFILALTVLIAWGGASLVKRTGEKCARQRPRKGTEYPAERSDCP